jgi:hypothetical protein
VATGSAWPEAYTRNIFSTCPHINPQNVDRHDMYYNLDDFMWRWGMGYLVLVIVIAAILLESIAVRPNAR